MTRPEAITPPLTPVLLAALPAQLLPLGPLAPLLDAAMLAMRRRHPDLLERLAGIERARFLIDPLDLPFAFLLEADRAPPRLRALREAPSQAPAATIRGPLLTLIELFQGRLDGDAAFFARELVIEGDTEAVVALRNAIDAAEIDLLADLLALLGPLARPARAAGGLAGRLLARAAADLELVHAAALEPAMRRLERQAAELRRLGERIGDSDRARRAPRRAS